MFIIAQVFGILIIITNVLSMQMKHKKQIIFMSALVNLLSAIDFILLQSYSGTIICLFAIIQVVINNFFEKKQKRVPNIIIGMYIVISILLGLITFSSIIDVLPIICAILYTITILQDKEKNIRRISLVNIILWIIYDIICLAYTTAISDFLILISTIVGMYRFDFKNNKNMSLNIINELVVANVQSSIQFYEDNFNFITEMTEGEPITWAQLKNNEAIIMLEDYNTVKSEISNYPSKVHNSNLIKFEYNELKEIKELYKKLKQNNVEFFIEYTETDYGKAEFGILDPDKNMILLSAVI